MPFFRINSSEPYIINAIDGVDASDVIGSANIGLAIDGVSNIYGPDRKLFRYVDTKARLNLYNGSIVNYYDGGVLKNASFEYTANNLISLDLGFILLSSGNISAIVVSYNDDLYLADGNRHYLYLMSNGNYCISSANRVGETVSWYPGGDTVTFDEYIGEYIVGSSIGENIDQVENEVSITINPATLSLTRNSGIVRTLFSDYIVDIKIGDTEYENVSKYYSRFSPNDDAVTIVGLLAGLDFNTDNLSHSEYVISFSEPKTGAILNVSVSVLGNSSPYEPGGTSSIGGGGGNFGQGVPNDNVTVDIPIGSNFGYVGGSMFTHYALSGNQVELFGEWLWTEDLGLSLWKTAMEKIFNETADALIGLMAFPFNISTLPNVSLVDGTIKAGNLPTGIAARVLQSPYTQVDWGTIQLTEYWGNFLDYAPHTKIELYLPWSTGFVPIDPHQCLPGSLSVKTNIDLQKGTCTHNVLAGTTVLGVYEGQVGYEIPLLASNFSAKLAGATVAAVSTAVSGLAAGSAAVSSAVKISNAINTTNKEIGALAYSRSGILNANPMAYVTSEEMMAISRFNAPNRSAEVNTFNAVSRGLPSQIASKSSVATAKQPVNVSRNGSFSGSSAGLSIPYPYVIISRPEQNVPIGYGHFNGYPSNVGVSNMLQLKGYTEIGAIHLNGIRAVPDELAELDDILKGGFII